MSLFQLIFICFTCTYSIHQNLGTLEVEINHLDNTKGHLLVSLFDKEKGFLEEESLFRKQTVKQITGLTQKVYFRNVPYGDYALAVIHDENANGDVDSNFLGIPSEGYGFSGPEKGRIFPPNFKEAKVSLNSPSKNVKVEMYYLPIGR